MDQSLTIPSRVEEKLIHFTGREWLLEKIDHWLNDNGGSRMFLLSGKPGTGKSMIAAWLCSRRRGLKPAGKYGQMYTTIHKKIRAAYFCIARDNVSPRELALSMSKQLFATLPGFNDALASTLPDRNIPNVTITPGNVTNSNIIGNIFNNFNAGDLDDEPSFDRLLSGPLKQLYQSESCKEPALFIIDGLDEAMTYTGRTNIVVLLNKLLEISPYVRLFATTRPDPDVLDRFPFVQPFDLTGPEGGDLADLSVYVKNCLSILPKMDQERLAGKITTTVNGNFLFASLVLEDLLPRLKNIQDIEEIRLPKSLDELYIKFLDREVNDGDTFLKEDKPVLAMIAIGQGPGLTSGLIQSFSGVGPEGSLRRYKQYLEGDLPVGPFRPFHKSLTDFFLDEKNTSRFKVEAGPEHLKIVDHYCDEAGCIQSYPTWDEYGMNFVFSHFADAVKNTEDINRRHNLAKRLASLLSDPDFQKSYESRLKDLAIQNQRLPRKGKPVLYQVPPFIEAWQNNLEMALRTVVLNEHPQGALLVVDVALRLSAFRHQLLRTDLLFQLAGAGNLEEAEYRLNYFDTELRWHQAALLLFAWLASGVAEKQQEARALVTRMEQQLVQSNVLTLLLKWVKAGLDGKEVPAADLPWLPGAPQEGEALNIVLHVADMTAKNVSYLSELDDVQKMDARAQMNMPEFFANPEELTKRGNNIEELPAYLGYEHGPKLVAFAKQNEEKAKDLLRQYISAHAANGYVYYRNRSLWGLMKPLLSFPKAGFVKEVLPDLLSAALSASPYDFKEGLAVALLGQVGKPDPWQALQDRKGLWEKESSELTSVREWGDAWGNHCRRFGSLAETEFCLFSEKAGPAPLDLLKAALRLPRGFAGYRAPALLSLVESMIICCAPGDLIEQALKNAEESACNITDPVFCMRMTARVQAIRVIIGSMARAAFNPYDQITAFLDHPQSQPGATIHILGNVYEARQRNSKGSIELPQLCYDARTFDDLKLIYQQPFREFIRLNPEIDPNQPIKVKTVLVPDPDFTPPLAAFYTAVALSHPDLTTTDRRTLIQQLLPLTLSNPTALDVTMARLILTAKPQDHQAVEAMFSYLSKKIGF